MNGWLETYRGIVYRWEVDHNDHLTVAFYFARLGDATLTLLDSLGLGRDYTRRRGNLCLTADCYVRYVRELRVGDIMHVVSGVIAVERDALVLGHKLFNSETGEVCTTVEQRVRHVDARRRTAGPCWRLSAGRPSSDGSSGTSRHVSAARGRAGSTASTKAHAIRSSPTRWTSSGRSR